MVNQLANPRKVTLQLMRRLVDAAAGNPVDPPKLQPNHIQLYAYYKPGLLAGDYAIEARQDVTTEGPFPIKEEKLSIYNRKKPVQDPNAIEPQIFKVVAPQFSLDPKLVDSHYPPDGHQDEARILPHIVLNDPHFPWERRADNKIDELQDPDHDANNQYLDKMGHVVPGNDPEKASKRNAVPWVALMVFDPSELGPLNAVDVSTLNLNGVVDLSKQPATGAYQMTVGQYLNITRSNRVDFEDGIGNTPIGLKELNDIKDSQEKMTAIFPTKAKFLELFPDIASLKYTSHVRNINTTGFPGAGIDELGLYSIVISSRMGNYTEPKPITQICHLVSIEHFQTTKDSIQSGNDRIGLISLYSWTYTALPPDGFNFLNVISHVLDGRQPLRPKNDVIDSLTPAVQSPKSPAEAKAINSLNRRFNSGYTLARWRAETGEESAAFSRGPLVPAKVKPFLDWPTSSNTSKDYQILDTATGFMDLSYSSAWQLGKTLATSDTTFSAALSRLRSWIQKWSESKTRLAINFVPSRTGLVTGLLDNVHAISGLTAGDAGDPRRVTAPANGPGALAPPLTDPAVAPILHQNIATAVLTAGSAGEEIYHEFNSAGHNNTDWTLIHKWISDKLFLSDIPAHVLIQDPSFLPDESVRFFHIDDIWMDCLIDGALSIGNHLERDGDRVREEIKQTYNAYLRHTSLPILPQIPGYGFILRSKIVKVMPDMRITVKWKAADARMPWSQYIRPDDHTIMCLLDRPFEELQFIELAQPPHQQRFSFGSGLVGPNLDQFQFEARKLFTDGTKTESDIDSAPQGGFSPPKNEWTAVDVPWSQSQKWLWPAAANVKPRILKLNDLANGVHEIILANSNSETNKTRYVDYVANSAELALELNDPSYYFRIVPPSDPNAPNPPPITPRNRQLLCQNNLPDPTARGPIGQPPAKPSDSSVIGDAPPPKIPAANTSLHPITVTPPDKATNVIVKDTNPVPANPSAPLGTPQPLVTFNVQIFADYKGPPKIWPDDNAFDKGNYISTQNDYLYDLIFSVRKDPKRSRSDYRLREILFNIPHSGVRSPTEPLLNAGSSAPKARILSNQRFVILMNWTAEYLQVRLVPRSAEEHPVMVINDKRTKEISFRLEEVDVPPTRTKVWVPIHASNKEQLGVVKVDVYERYETPGGVVSAAPAPRSVFLVKRDIRDEVIYQ